MKVLLISDSTSGGAGIACRRLFEALRARIKDETGDLRPEWEAEARDRRLEESSKKIDHRHETRDHRPEQDTEDRGHSPSSDYGAVSAALRDNRQMRVGCNSKTLNLLRRERIRLWRKPGTLNSPTEIRWLAMSGKKGAFGRRDEGGDLKPEGETEDRRERREDRGEADHVIDIGRLDRKWIRRMAFRFTPKDERKTHWLNRWKTWGLENDVLCYIKKFNPDVINLHNIHLASFRLFERLPKHIKIIWTLHDMWPLTGYCVYSFGCEKYATGCKGECPQWSKWGEVAYSPEKEWKRRERAFRRRDEGGNLRPDWETEDRRLKTEDRGQRAEDRGSVARDNRHQTADCGPNSTREQPKNLTTDKNEIIFVAPSKWMAECARKRFGDRVRVEHIPYGLPLDVFKPVDKASVRNELGLPIDAKIILAGADNVKEKRKGFKDLIEAMEGLGRGIEQRAEGREQGEEERDHRQQTIDHRPAWEEGTQDRGKRIEDSGEREDGDSLKNKICLVTFGGSMPPLSGKSFAHIHAGSIQDEQLLAKYYAVADVFVLPTYADNLPNTLLEAMACGTPCVAYDVGGCKDIIEDGVTGGVAEAGSVKDLTENIAGIISLDGEAEKQMRHSSRARAEEMFVPTKQAGRYGVVFD